jgi:tRNA nucleotidyltransferase (CCA-adding enzyme)
MAFPADLNSLIDTRLDHRYRLLLRSAGKLADRKGWKVYLVGGSVRDLLLGLDNFDLDLLVEEHGLQFARRWAKEERGFFKTHRRFATAMVIMPGGLKVDITTTRSESYRRPGALPEILPGSLEEDLGRRDFTINALACSLNRDSFGRLIDTCGGRKDLARGLSGFFTRGVSGMIPPGSSERFVFSRGWVSVSSRGRRSGSGVP